MAKQNQWTRITDADNSKINTKERAARKLLEAEVQAAMQRYHDTGGIIHSMEMYPCDHAECRADAAKIGLAPFC